MPAVRQFLVAAVVGEELDKLDGPALTMATEVTMTATGETDVVSSSLSRLDIDDQEQPSSLAEEAKTVLDTIERLMAQGKEVEEDIRDADSARLAPGRAIRLRKKSKDLQNQVFALLEPSLERVFKSFDLDGNGTLDKSELKAAFEAAGRPISDAKIAKAMATIDTDGSGAIDFQEFKQLTYLTGTMPTSPLKSRAA